MAKKSPRRIRTGRKRASTRPRRGGGQSRVPRGMQLLPSNVPTNIVEQVCSNYDPFCPAAMGGKLFDDNTTPSLTYQNRQFLSITTNADGVALININNTPTNYYNTATIVAGAVTAWTNNNANFYSTIGLVGISQWRVVSTGVRYLTTQAWTAATGYCVVTEANEPFNGAVGQIATSLRLGPRSRAIALRDANVTLIGRSKGMTSRTYKEASDTDSGYTGAYLYFNGTASTTIGYLEVVTNYEWMADPDSAYQYFVTPAAPHKKLVLDSVTTLSTATDSIKSLNGGLDRAASFMGEAKTAIHKTAGMIDDIAAIGATINPAFRLPGYGAHVIRQLTN